MSRLLANQRDQRDGNKVVLLYAKKKPPFSSFYDDSEITAVTAKVISRDGTVLESGIALAYQANLNGYVLEYDYSAHVAQAWLLFVLEPTRAASVPVALTPPKQYEVDLSDLQERQNELETQVEQVKVEVWDEPLDDHLSSRSTGRALADANTVLDPDNIAKKVWDRPKASHTTTGSFGELAPDVAALQSKLDNATFGLSALKALLDSVLAKLGAPTDAAGTTTVFARLRQIIDTYLANATHGAAALNADLDALLARLGLTSDVGGTATAGTAMAKVNQVLLNQAAERPPAIEDFGVEPVS